MKPKKGTANILKKIHFFPFRQIRLGNRIYGISDKNYSENSKDVCILDLPWSKNRSEKDL